MKRIKTIFLLSVLMILLSATTSYAQQVKKPESSQPGATKQQLKVALINTQNALEFANANLIRCDAAYNDLKASSEADQAAITAAAAERKIYADLVAKFTLEVSTLKSALSDKNEALIIADKRADTAIKEVDRQKKKVSFWKKAAKYGTIIGAAAGAAAVVERQLEFRSSDN